MTNPPKRQLSKAKATEPIPIDRSSSPLTPSQSSSRISGSSARDQTGDSRLESNYHIMVKKHAETKSQLDNLDANIEQINGRFNGMKETFTNIIEAINQLLTRVTTPSTNPRAVPPHIKQEDLSAEKTYSFHLKHSLKDPMALHQLIHSDCEMLKLNGDNFLTWEHQINTTLDFVFHTKGFLQGNNWNTLNADQNPAVVILLQSSVDRLLSTAVVTSKKPEDIFKSLCTRCKRGDQQHKFSLMNRLRDFYGAEHPESNDQMLAEFQDFYLELKQQNINTEELFGLILQTVIKPPLDVDENAFRNNLNHRLNTAGKNISLDRCGKKNRLSR
ncbi:hypothetical protein VP01_1291g3 [Puccinia sorghi]|uniref:Uncharacterized protein n=1 Tax=Puccinia sorghi TaxID=27349 RepID=A0A0L6VNQ9_9BASI|nr:hypothetical protein VP01_1291g3 [Puccinia sorghi]